VPDQSLVAAVAVDVMVDYRSFDSIASASITGPWSFSFDLAIGDKAFQVNRVFSAANTVGPGSAVIYQFRDGSLKNRFGESLVFANLKVLWFVNLTNNITLNLAGDFIPNVIGGTFVIIKVPPGGHLLCSSPIEGYAMDSTHKEIIVSHDDPLLTASYKIMAMGHG
jgi:hypothetical protein